MNKAVELLTPLDSDQQEVATIFDRPVVVIAGAGTGKTRAITYRIAYGAMTGQIDCSKTLAVTFTTKAAGEMKSRLKYLGVGRVQARTFHSVALRISKYFWPKAYGSELPELAPSRISMLSEATGRLGIKANTGLLKDLSNEISWAKTCNVLARNYVQVAQASNRAIAGLSLAQVSEVFDGYEQIKRRKEKIDYDDILLCVVALLHENSAVLATVQDRYKHFVVDEFQDVNPIQYRFLNQLLGNRESICVVGDPRQAIHGFAGANVKYFQTFIADHQKVQIVQLNRDYRSTKPIVRLANQILESKAKTYQHTNQLKSMVGEGPPVVVKNFPTQTIEAENIANWLSDLHHHGVEWKDMAVLYRINAQSAPLEAVFTQTGIPYQIHGEQNFYQRPEIRQALDLFSRQREQAPKDAKVKNVVTQLLSSIGMTQTPPTGGGRARQVWESLQALNQLASETLDQSPDLTFAQLVDKFMQSADIEHAPQINGVNLMSMHSSKGLEWDAVALFSIDDQSVPFVLATTQSQIDEEKRLLYVGVTRARKHLHISWSTGQSATKSPSRFLPKEYLGMNPSSTNQSARHKPGGKNRFHPKLSVHQIKCRVCGKGLSFGVELKLGRHTGCETEISKLLLDKLVDWRKKQAEKQRVPAFVVLSDATLVAIAEVEPKTSQELLAIRGIGLVKLEKYGEDILNMIANNHR